jgi:DNA adenine methylase
LSAPTRPVLRYHGGKFRIADWVVSFFPDHAAYLEPFGGAASVLLRKPVVGTEIYNDLDGDVVNLFRLLRDHDMAAELAHRLRFTTFSRTEFDAAYEPPVDLIDQAHKLIVRSFMGHGSDSATRRTQPGFRSKRSRSKSQGGHMSASPAREFSTFPDALLEFHERLAGVVIENRPALDLIEQFDSPSTLIYADPPYCLSARTLMRGSANSPHGYRHEMTDDDHCALAERLRECKSMVVISGYATTLYDQELYRDWQRFERKAIAEAGATRTEVVWLNPACTAALIQQQAQQRLIA